MGDGEGGKEVVDLVFLLKGEVCFLTAGLHLNNLAKPYLSFKNTLYYKVIAKKKKSTEEIGWVLYKYFKLSF